ncbi:hypothetical protein ACFP3I_23180 [Chryseobacterium arachidis]
MLQLCNYQWMKTYLFRNYINQISEFLFHYITAKSLFKANFAKN